MPSGSAITPGMLSSSPVRISRMGYPERIHDPAWKVTGRKDRQIKEVLVPAGSLDKVVFDRLLAGDSAIVSSKP